MSALIGNVASDLAKIRIASIMAALGGLAIGAYTSVAIVPIGVAILVGVLAGKGLEWLDQKYDLTNKLVEALEKLGDRIGELQAQTKYFQYQGQESQLIGQAKLHNMYGHG